MLPRFLDLHGLTRLCLPGRRLKHKLLREGWLGEEVALEHGLGLLRFGFGAALLLPTCLV